MTLVRRPTQEARRTATREALLRAAVELVAKKGAAAATLQDVAEAAGLTKGAIFYHFHNKDELLDAVLETCVEALRRRATDPPSGATPPERVRATLRTLWSLRRNPGPELVALADLAALGLHEPRVRAGVSSALREVERDLAQRVVGELGALGLRPRVAPSVAPRLLAGLLDGVALHALLGDGTDDEELLKGVELIALGLFAP